MNKLQIVFSPNLENASSHSDSFSEILERCNEFVLNSEGYKNTLISLAFLEADEMKYINSKTRGKDKVTNVLSFSYLETEQPNLEFIHLGEIFICLKQVEEDAKVSERTLLEELVFIYIHALLHLVGYDHKEECQAENMEDREEQYLKVFMSNI